MPKGRPPQLFPLFAAAVFERGGAAAGLALTLWALEADRRLLGTFTTNADGRTDGPILPEARFAAGAYELVFHVGAWLDAQDAPGPAPRFLDEVPIRFGMAADDHYHVPLLVSPYGYSTYRGS